MSEQTRHLSAHERIMKLREEFGIPEEETDPEEDAKWERDREARQKRMDMAVTEENYVKMFGRDPWTDEPIPGMKPTVEIAETSRKETEQAAKKQAKISHAEWRAKYIQSLPTIHLPAEEKESKKVRKLRKKRKAYEEKQVRQQQIDVAYWWLETQLSKSYANELYYKYRNDLDALIDLCYQWAVDWAEDMTWDEDPYIPIEEAAERLRQKRIDDAEVVEDVGGLKFKRRDVVEKHRREYNINPFENLFPDIPDEYWEEFCEWSKEEPLSKYRKQAKKYAYRNLSPYGLRRIAFLKKINKRNKSWRKNLMLHDPISGASFVSEKKMRSHIQAQLKKYDQQRKKLVTMLDHMVADGQISEDYANHMMGDTKLVRDRIRKRWEEEYDRMKVRHKEEMKRYKHQKKTYDARKKWYEKHGGKLGDLPVMFDVDGNEVKIQAIQPKSKHGKIIYRVDDGNGNTRYSESGLYDALDISKPPTEPSLPAKPNFSKEYWEDYNQLPPY